MSDHRNSRTPDPTARVFAAFEGRAQALRALLSLQERQRDALDRDDSEGVLSVLAERQNVIDGLADRDAELRAADELFEKWAPTASPRERARAEATRNEVHGLARQLAALDAEDGARLRRRADELSEEMASLAAVHKASGAYGGPAPSGPRYQDRSA
jgi:hypothetical protein